jgi:hypothetical protein
MWLEVMIRLKNHLIHLMNKKLWKLIQKSKVTLYTDEFQKSYKFNKVYDFNSKQIEIFEET